jgi:hypothetical protein
MTLSPAAQAVLDAANGASSYGPDDCLNESRWIAAAALRAAADQVVPEEPEPDQSAMTFSDWNLKTESWDARMATRSELLAIAAELEQADD